MSLLKEIAVRAKWDGSFTQEWSTLRSSFVRDGGLADFPGNTNIERLKAWAEHEGLLMDFDFEFRGFSAEISTVMFWNAGQRDAVKNADQNGVDPNCAIHNDFDWNSVAGAADSDDGEWAALSLDVVFSFIAKPNEALPQQVSEESKAARSSQTVSEVSELLMATAAQMAEVVVAAEVNSDTPLKSVAEIATEHEAPTTPALISDACELQPCVAPACPEPDVAIAASIKTGEPSSDREAGDALVAHMTGLASETCEPLPRQDADESAKRELAGSISGVCDSNPNRENSFAQDGEMAAMISEVSESYSDGNTADIQDCDLTSAIVEKSQLIGDPEGGKNQDHGTPPAALDSNVHQKCDGQDDAKRCPERHGKGRLPGQPGHKAARRTVSPSRESVASQTPKDSKEAPEISARPPTSSAKHGLNGPRNSAQVVKKAAVPGLGSPAAGRLTSLRTRRVERPTADRGLEVEGASDKQPGKVQRVKTKVVTGPARSPKP